MTRRDLVAYAIALIPGVVCSSLMFILIKKGAL